MCFWDGEVRDFFEDFLGLFYFGLREIALIESFDKLGGSLMGRKRGSLPISNPSTGSKQQQTLPSSLNADNQVQEMNWNSDMRSSSSLRA